MLTKEIEIDQIEIVGPFKMVQIREATVIREDGVELTRSFHRRVVSPSCDTVSESAEITTICGAVHSADIKSKHTAHLKVQEEKREAIKKAIADAKKAKLEAKVEE